MALLTYLIPLVDGIMKLDFPCLQVYSDSSLLTGKTSRSAAKLKLHLKTAIVHQYISRIRILPNTRQIEILSLKQIEQLILPQSADLTRIIALNSFETARTMQESVFIFIYGNNRENSVGVNNRFTGSRYALLDACGGCVLFLSPGFLAARGFL